MLTDEKFLDDPRRAVQLGLGIASPLWSTFFVATSAGVAFWAWSQWMRGKAQSEFSPLLAGAPVAAAPTAPQPIPEPIAEVAFAAAEIVEEATEIPAPVTEAVSEAISSSAAILASSEDIPDPIELTPEALAGEADASEVEVAAAPAVEPIAEAAKPVRRKRVEAEAPEAAVAPAKAAPEPKSETKPEPPTPPRKPRAQAVAAVSPRKVRAAKAAGEPSPTGPKHRRIAPRRKG